MRDTYVMQSISTGSASPDKQMDIKGQQEVEGKDLGGRVLNSIIGRYALGGWSSKYESVFFFSGHGNGRLTGDINGAVSVFAFETGEGC
jgi:hypothetical protein